MPKSITGVAVLVVTVVKVSNAIALDANENVYTVGKYRNTVDFDPGSGAVLLTSSGESDIFIQKLDANGSLLWVKSIEVTVSTMRTILPLMLMAIYI